MSAHHFLVRGVEGKGNRRHDVDDHPVTAQQYRRSTLPVYTSISPARSCGPIERPHLVRFGQSVGQCDCPNPQVPEPEYYGRSSVSRCSLSEHSHTKPSNTIARQYISFLDQVTAHTGQCAIESRLPINVDTDRVSAGIFRRDPVSGGYAGGDKCLRAVWPAIGLHPEDY
jgi:hypothetical protein